MMDPKLRMCLVSIGFPRLNLGYYNYAVVTLVALLRFWLDNLKIMLHYFTHVMEYSIDDDQDHCIN
jgi:hypothetical protein